MKVVLTYRVLPHWRTPVFRRLDAWEGIEFVALHGSDFPGTGTVNGRDLTGFSHRELWTLRVISTVRSEREITMPLCPTLPFHLMRERPDVILAEGGSNLANNFLVFAYAALTRTPVVWWTLGALDHGEPLVWWQRLFRGIVRAMERRATALLGYSSEALEYFEREGHPPERQFRAVNCVDTDLVAERADSARDEAGSLRERLGLVDKRVLLFVGKLAPFKRVEDLITVYGRLRAAHPELRLVVVGGGAHLPVLEAFAASEGIDDVIFTGEVVEGVATYFEIGDLLVLPGLGGLVISEAMAHGLPIVATRADGCERDLIGEGENGHVVPVGEIEALGAAIEDVLRDGRLEAMGEASRQRIRDRYNIGRYMENLVAALRYAAGADAPRGGDR